MQFILNSLSYKRRVIVEGGRSKCDGEGSVLATVGIGAHGDVDDKCALESGLKEGWKGKAYLVFNLALGRERSSPHSHIVSSRVSKSLICVKNS